MTRPATKPRLLGPITPIFWLRLWCELGLLQHTNRQPPILTFYMSFGYFIFMTALNVSWLKVNVNIIWFLKPKRGLIDKDFGEFQYKCHQLRNPPIIVYIDNFYNTLLEVYYACYIVYCDQPRPSFHVSQISRYTGLVTSWIMKSRDSNFIMIRRFTT